MDRVSKRQSQGWRRRWKSHLTRRGNPTCPPSQTVIKGFGGSNGARTSLILTPKNSKFLTFVETLLTLKLWQVSPISFSTPTLVAQTVKDLHARQETQVQSLGWEHIPEKEMVTHSSILAWRYPGIEEPGEIQAVGHTESDKTE